MKRAIALGVAAAVMAAAGCTEARSENGGPVVDRNYQGNHGSAPQSFRMIGISFLGPIPVSTLIMLAALGATFGLAQWVSTAVQANAARHGS